MLSLHYVPGPVLNTLHRSTPFNSYKTHEGETIIIFIGMDKETEVSSFLCKFTGCGKVRMITGNLFLQLPFLKILGL